MINNYMHHPAMEPQPPSNTRIHRLHRKLREDLARVEGKAEVVNSYRLKAEYRGAAEGIALAIRRIETMWEEEDFSIWESRQYTSRPRTGNTSCHGMA